MAPPLLGLHHVTATADEAQADLDFCVGLLGLRLVKRTVNFDNHHVFHFYYGDEHGTPGTIWTTFPYRGHGVRIGTMGAGQVVATSFSVPVAAVDDWGRRFETAGLDCRNHEVFGEPRLTVRDPSGLVMEIVGTSGDARQPWVAGDVDPGMAIRGLHAVTCLVRALEPTTAFLADVLGCPVVEEAADRVRVRVGTGGTGRQIEIRHDPDAAPGVNGLGTVHHVALAITDENAQRALHVDLQRRGVQVTRIMDRQYFRSIYFREPGGVLIEVATLAPGFAYDEPLAQLGTSLKLPPWQEPNRAEIEAGLPPVTIR